MEENNKSLHLMVTSLCKRNCPHCCNKQMELPPQVTDEDIVQCNTLCITGGEPFLFANPVEIAKYYRSHYYNIKNIYVYTNAIELKKYLDYQYSEISEKLQYFDGLNIGIKSIYDAQALLNILFVLSVAIGKGYIQSNRIYYMLSDEEPYSGTYYYDILNMIKSRNLMKYFNIIDRKWQKEFVAADNSIFRRV